VIEGPLRLSYGTVRLSQRQVIYALRVHDALLDLREIDDLMTRMRERLAHRGEPVAEIVVVQGDAKETLRLFGAPYSVNRVRAAMFSAAIRWMPYDLGETS
jgi:hypothetical protein